MKHPVLLCHGVLAALALAGVTTRAQVTDYNADAATNPNTVQRLWLDSGETQAAPTGTALWFVADTTGSGFSGSTVTDAQIQNIANQTDSIQRFYSDTVPGSIIFSAPGKYQRGGILVPGQYSTASIGVMLWNDANHDSTIGDAGDTFGFYNFGVVPPPSDFGNAQYLINSNIHADQYLIVPVPEPAQAAMAIGVLCLGAVVVRRFQTALAS